MKTISVRLSDYDLEMLEKLLPALQKDWITKITISDAIRYAIYCCYCDANGAIGEECFNCTKDSYKKAKADSVQ